MHFFIYFSEPDSLYSSLLCEIKSYGNYTSVLDQKCAETFRYVMKLQWYTCYTTPLVLEKRHFDCFKHLSLGIQKFDWNNLSYERLQSNFCKCSAFLVEGV